MKALILMILGTASFAQASVVCTVDEGSGANNVRYNISADSSGVRDLKKFQLKLFPDAVLVIAKNDDTEYSVHVSSFDKNGVSNLGVSGSGHLILQSMSPTGLVRAECTNK